ncbi:hypothetical protein OA408_00390 [Acidimicrobiaceae bacterium]|nr:hypothetical protein [Acidimicrobiaceae bacterium]
MPKKTCIVTLKGGIGNQLLQYNFAKLLQDEGYSVKIDNRFFWDYRFSVGNTERNQLFDPSFFGFDNMKRLEYLFRDNFEKIYHSSFVKNNLVFFQNYIFGFFKDQSSFDLINLPKISVFDGYWQDVNDLDSYKRFLIEKLQKSKEFKMAINAKKLSGSTMLHIRRTDYIKLNQELENDYYFKAIKIMNEKIKDFNYSIFTDDKRWAENQVFSKKALNIFSPEDFKDDFSSFCEMIKFENYIIANSTYSYTVALLGSMNKSLVIYPKIWFKDRKKQINFKESWISV